MATAESPTISKVARSPSQKSGMSPKDWGKSLLRSGTSKEKLEQAFKTFENAVGPGQYDHKDLNGRSLSLSVHSNVPNFSIGHPRAPNVVNPETRNTILSPHKTPAGAAYSIPADNPYFNKNKVNHKTKEEKFFQLKNMPTIKAQC